MTDPSQPSALESQWRRSSTRRLLRWFFSWRIQRRLLFAALTLVTLLALITAEENMRGRRAWDRYVKDLTARGQPYRLADVVPPPVPDDRNFVATPFWSKLNFAAGQTDHMDTNRWPREALSQASLEATRIRRKADPAWARLPRGKVEDLPALELSLRKVIHGDTNEPAVLPSAMDPAARREAAREILAYLKAFDSVLQELQEASRRTESRFAIKYDTDDPMTTLLPHLAVLKGVCQVVQTKASAELGAGNTSQALADVQLMLRLAEAIKNEPLLISYLVRIACVHITVKSVWEGLVFQQWTEPQLRVLQARLREFDLIEDSWRAVQGERCYGNAMFDFLHRHRGWASLDTIGESQPSDNSRPMKFGLFTVIPQGWLYLEQVNYNRMFDAMAGSAPAAGGARIVPSEVDARERASEKLFKGRGSIGRMLAHETLASLLLPAINKVFQKAAQAQVRVDHAVLACALERHRLSQGAYPATLEALVPRFIDALPPDVVGGQPYHYQAAKDGRFVVYSVGWNQKDDQGAEDKLPVNGDWVWQYP